MVSLTYSLYPNDSKACRSSFASMFPERSLSNLKKKQVSDTKISCKSLATGITLYQTFNTTLKIYNSFLHEKQGEIWVLTLN